MNRHWGLSEHTTKDNLCLVMIQYILLDTNNKDSVSHKKKLYMPNVAFLFPLSYICTDLLVERRG